MSVNENKVAARRFIQVWVPGNLGLVNELAAPGITVIYPGARGAGASRRRPSSNCWLTSMQRAPTSRFPSRNRSAKRTESRCAGA